MRDDYLWDRSGPPDPEVQRLEQVLGTLGHRGGQPAPAAVAPARRRQVWAPLAAAAAIGITAVALMRIAAPPAVVTTWELVEVQGAPLLEGRTARTAVRLRAGETVRTPAGSSVILESEEVGRIELAPGSELQLVEAGSGRHRLQLPQGRIHAFIWAPPRRFVVDTPAARAVDLGCQYTLEVGSNGDGLLEVQTGWVAFQAGRHESFIPAGAACLTRRDRGPGTPYFQDAPEALRIALRRFDEGDADSLKAALASARPRDGLTLWHLLTRAPTEQRPAVFARYAELVPLPPAVTAEGVARGDREMLDACWDALGLDSADWWREWKRDWQR